MKRLCVLAVAIVLAAQIASADPTNLEGGVLIAHHPPGLEFTSGQDWCERYENEFAITSCEQQNNRIDINGHASGSVWYVLAAWEEGKQFCAVEFGLGDYAVGDYPLVEHGPCGQDVLTIPTSGWPGPNEGIQMAAPLDSAWSGNYLPVYHFAGYAYGEGIVQLAVNPEQDSAGFANGETPPAKWDAAAMGGMGLLAEGIAACPQGGSAPEGLALGVCCTAGECWLATEGECGDVGGEFHLEWPSCDPNPCPQPPGGGENDAARGSGLTFIRLNTTFENFIPTAISLREDYAFKILIGYAPDGLICRGCISSRMEKDPRVSLVTQGAVSTSMGTDPAEPIDPAHVWNWVRTPVEASPPQTPPEMPQCLAEEGEEARMVPFDDPRRQTSVYMIGDVGIKLILPESSETGACPTEDWTVLEVTRVAQEVVQGLLFLADYTLDNDLAFFFPESHSLISMDLNMEPIQGASDGVETWGGEALLQLGFPNVDVLAQAADFANAKRSEFGLDWYFLSFIVEDECDTDHKFSDGRFAWAKLYGPYIVMTRHNNGWNWFNMDMVMRHETCHVFGADDEYEDPAGEDCADHCEEPFGYLRATTDNCYGCGAVQTSCIMAAASLQYDDIICPSTQAQIGWRDSDGDGPFDPIDHPDAGSNMLITPPELGVSPGDYLDILEHVSFDWAKRIGVSHRNSDYDGTVWDGIASNGIDCVVPQQFWLRKNGCGDLHDFMLDQDTTTPTLWDVSVSIAEDHEGPHTLTFEFNDTGDIPPRAIYSGCVRARVHLAGGGPETYGIFFDEFHVNTAVEPLSRRFYLPKTGRYELELLVWDVGGGHNATETVFLDAFDTSVSVEEHRILRPGIRVGPGTPSPTRNHVKWELQGTSGGPADLSIIGADGRVVRMWTKRSLGNGQTTILWDGLDNSGNRAPAGKYILLVRAQDGTTRTGEAVLVH